MKWDEQICRAIFRRSFKEIHGIPPSIARKKNVQLNLFPRITCLLTVKGDIQMECQIDSMSEQTVNLKGFNWAAWQSPSLEVYDNCIYRAIKWKEAGLKDLLDLGTGLGQNAIYFSKLGFNVSALDISDYAIQYLKNWAEKENLNITAAVGDMHSLPYDDNSFDCVYAYHVVSHTDSKGLEKTMAEIKRVLRPNGEVYLSFSSKESTEFMDDLWPKLDKNTLISQTEAEKGIPHFYVDLEDIKRIMENYHIESITHTEYCHLNFNSNTKPKFYYVSVKLK